VSAAAAPAIDRRRAAAASDNTLQRSDDMLQRLLPAATLERRGNIRRRQRHSRVLCAQGCAATCDVVIFHGMLIASLRISVASASFMPSDTM
jgi:hypothetical protein